MSDMSKDVIEKDKDSHRGRHTDRGDEERHEHARKLEVTSHLRGVREVHLPDVHPREVPAGTHKLEGVRNMKSLMDYPGPCPHCGGVKYVVFEEVCNLLTETVFKLTETNGCKRRECLNCGMEV